MAPNNKYLCDDNNSNHLILANRDLPSTWEIFNLICFENNECAIRSYTSKFLCPELNNQKEITATRITIGEWETFTIEYLDKDFVAFKASNEKYLSLDEKSLQVVASANTIGTNEKFKMIILK
jgi:hypothetical protein